MNRTKPCEVIGHAGADGFFPANTEQSFRKAIELGVDRIECDVTGDFDRVLFLVHDQVLLIDGTRRKVRSMPLEQIRQIDPLVVALEDLLAITEGKTPLLLDLKARGLEDDLILAIRALRDAEDDVSVSSTHARTLRTIAKAIPEMRVGLSRGHWVTRIPPRFRTLAGWVEGFLQVLPLLLLGKWCHATELMLYYRICTPPLIGAMHAAGFRIYAWTPERTSEFRTLLDRGVDGIITHRPDRLIATLEATGVPRL
ncbi:MAG TPA: glycerophosphodiester phosphodiesterase [Thermomicrobiales bacterium]|nr:glycerophosphodiester phosphodiesterase [Thermomicrobiales bacterium]